MSIESILIWLALGAITGWVAGKLYQGSGFGLATNIIIGIVGSFLGGWLAGRLGISGAETGGFSIASILTAVVGAVILLFVIGRLKKA